MEISATFSHQDTSTYIDHIETEHFRTFRKSQIAFCHADRDYKADGLPKPRLANMNLLLANNGYGKTTLLKAIALAALGPAVAQAYFSVEDNNKTQSSLRAKRSNLYCTPDCRVGLPPSSQ